MTFKETDKSDHLLAAQAVPHFAQRPNIDRQGTIVESQPSITTIPRSAPVGYRVATADSTVVVAPRQLTLAEKQARSQLAYQTFIAPALNDINYDEIVLNNTKPCIVLFSTRSCGSCTSLKMNAWQELYSNHKDQFDFYEFSCTENTKTDKNEDINAHPSLLFFNKGKCIGTYLGYSQYEYYANYIKTLKF